jgi:alpha-1,3-rhamnosyl/mannosyltransferase
MDDAAVDRILGQHELSSGKYVLFLGNLTSRKDPLSLVRAFRLIHDRFPDIELVFAGALGSGAVGILAEIDELRLGRRVRVIGHVSDDDATGLLLGAAVLSLPSLYEGFGLPVLEAMACGIPVVASNGGALPEVIGDAGIVVPAQRPDALSDALRAVLSDSGLRRELKSAGRARVREFSWVRCAEETSAVYRVATSAGVAPNRRASGYPSASHRADRARGESTR